LCWSRRRRLSKAGTQRQCRRTANAYGPLVSGVLRMHGAQATAGDRSSSLHKLKDLSRRHPADCPSTSSKFCAYPESGLRTARGEREHWSARREAGATGSFELRRRTGHRMVLRIIFQLLGRDGRAEEVLEVLEHILLGGSKCARLGVRFELITHADAGKTLRKEERGAMQELAERPNPSTLTLETQKSVIISRHACPQSLGGG